MIRMVSDFPDEGLKEYCSASVPGIRIYSLLCAYGTDLPFVRVYKQTKKDGSITAAFSMLDGAVILSANADADLSELTEFFNVFGVSAVNCNLRIGQAMGLVLFEAHTLLKLDTPVENLRSSAGLTFMNNPSPLTLYEILNNNRGSGINVEDRDGFYLDMSHRMRHHAARAAAAYKEDEPAGCIFTTAETSGSAFIGGLAVNEAYRHKKIGSLLLQRLCLNLLSEGKCVFAAAENNVVPFYEKNGFLAHGIMGFFQVKP